MILGEEKTPEVDQCGLEKRRPFPRGDQRFESPLLQRVEPRCRMNLKFIGSAIRPSTFRSIRMGIVI